MRQQGDDGGCPDGHTCETDENGKTVVRDSSGNIVDKQFSTSSEDRQREVAGKVWQGIGDVTEEVGKEVAFMVVGGTVVRLVFKGGKWVVTGYRAYKASQNVAKLGIRVTKDGLGGSLKFGDQIIDYGVESAVKGSTLFVREVAIYGRGAAGNELAGTMGARVGLLVKKAVIEWAKSQRLSKISYQFTRTANSSSIKKGQRAVEVIDLN